MKTRVSVQEWRRRLPPNSNEYPDIGTNMAKVDTLIFSMRTSLNILLQENIKRSQTIKKLLKIFGSDPNKSEKEAKYVSKELAALLQANISTLENVKR